MSHDYSKELIAITVVDNNSSDNTASILEKYHVNLLKQKEIESKRREPLKTCLTNQLEYIMSSHVLEVPKKRFTKNTMILLFPFAYGVIVAIMMLLSLNLGFIAAAAPLILCVYQKPKFGIYLMLLPIYLFSFLASDKVGILPRASEWIFEGLLVILGLKALISNFGEKTQITFFDLCFLCLVFIGIISSLINEISFLTAILAFRYHFKFIIMFYILVALKIDESTYKKIFLYLFIIALLQVPVTFWQFVTWAPSTLDFTDAAGGTFGIGDTTGFLAIFLSGIICMLVAFTIYRGSKTLFMASILFLLIPIFLSQSVASFLILPLAILYMLRKTLFKRKAASLVLISILMIFFAVVFQFRPTIGGRKAGYKIEWNRLYEKQVELDTSEDLGKIASIKYSIDLISQDSLNLLIGYGMGAAMDSYFEDFKGRFAKQFYELGIKPQISYTLTEFGILGLSLYVILLIYIYNINTQFGKNSHDMYWSAISYGFSGIIIIYTISAFYRNVWDQDTTAFAFWFICAAIFSVGKVQRSTRDDNYAS